MKKIKYIILSMVILSMTLGNVSFIMGQEKLLFSETYTYHEFMAHLEQEKPFLELLDLPQTNPENARLGSCTEANTETLWDYLHSAPVQRHLPEDLKFAWGWDSGEGTRTLFALRESKKARTPGIKDIQSIATSKGHQEDSYDLLLTFSDEGAKLWADMTRNNVNRNIAIVLDGKVVTAPSVQEEIKMGKCLISGNFDQKEASDIKAILEGK